MLELQTALINWFKQFTDRVYIEGYAFENVNGIPTKPPFPYITFSYASSDMFVNNLMSFQIWDRSIPFPNPLRVLNIAGSIEKALPVLGGITLDIKSDTIHRFVNPDTGLWQEVDIRDIEDITWDFATREPPYIIKWDEIQGRAVGSLQLYRGTPFIQPRNTDDQTVIVFYGNIEIRSHLI